MSILRPWSSQRAVSTLWFGGSYLSFTSGTHQFFFIAGHICMFSAFTVVTNNLKILSLKQSFFSCVRSHRDFWEGGFLLGSAGLCWTQCYMSFYYGTLVKGRSSRRRVISVRGGGAVLAMSLKVSAEM